LLTFAGEGDRDIYIGHKEHQNFKNIAAPFIDKVFVFDYCPGARATRGSVVDLTHVLCSGIPDYEGRNDVFQYKTLVTIAKDGYTAGSFAMPEHYGTHMDAPSHFCAGAKSIDELPAEKLIVPCVVIDLRKEVQDDIDYRLTVGKIKSFEGHGEIPPGAVVLLWTGWADRWSTPALYRNADAKGVMHFPGVGLEAADYLINTRHVAGLGIDTLSMDYGASSDFPVHKLALSKGLFLIENLDNLSLLPSRNAQLFLGPLRIKGGTGSPARVMAVVP
jgi:kynurenine formamidase